MIELQSGKEKSESKELGQAVSIYNEILKKFPGNAKAKLGLKSIENPNKNEINLIVNLYQKKISECSSTWKRAFKKFIQER